MLTNSLFIKAPKAVTNALETNFQSLVESLDSKEENEILIWTEDVNHEVIDQETIRKTGLTKSKITNSLGKFNIEEIQNYISTKRAISRKSYVNANNNFYSSVIKKSNSKVLFQSQYSPVFILKGSKEQLSAVLSSNKVKNAAKHQTFELSHYSEISNINTGVQYLRDAPSLGGDGENVIIGILDRGFPNVNQTYGTYSLFDNSKISYANLGTRIDPHATNVAALMVGQTVVYNGTTYKGVAPKANLVCAYPVNTNESNVADMNDINIRIAIESLLSANVNIINASLGDQFELDIYSDDNNVQYYEMIRWIDHIAFNHDVHFVTAAGNMKTLEEMAGSNPYLSDVNADGYEDSTEYVNLLGMSYNAITVGNVHHNNDVTESIAPPTLSLQTSTPFTIAPKSAYRTWNSNFCKPDISCFGNVQYADMLKDGTSLSSPQVAGMIAQLCSIYPQLLTNNSGIKALLAATAVYLTNDTLTKDTKDGSSELWDRQGAGIANVHCAYACYSSGKTLDLTLSGQTAMYSFNINVPSNYTYLRLAMSWIRKANLSNHQSNNHPTAIPPDVGLANFDVHVYHNGQLVALSENFVTNLEVLQFDVTQGGTYTVKIFNRSYEIDNTDYGNQYISVAWY